MSVTAKVTDASFDTDVINSQEPVVVILGGMVWTLPHDRARA